jgi:hypothetical protein
MALNLLSQLYPNLNVSSFNHELHILYVSRFTLVTSRQQRGTTQNLECCLGVNIEDTPFILRSTINDKEQDVNC